MPTIANAPSGEDTSIDGTEKIPLSGSKWTLISRILTYILANFTAASESAAGKVELATDAETITGTDTARAVTPANVQAKLANSASLTTLLANALPENTVLLLDAALSADGKYSGIAEAGTAGAALAFGDIVYLAVADSRWELIDADAAATAGPVKVGVCVLAAAADGDATIILLWGKVRADANFPTFTIGAPVYLSTTAGDLQVAAPSGSADIVRIIGYGNTADELFFCPDNTFIELA